MKFETTYFKEGSPDHTHHVIEVVKEYLRSNNEIDHIVIATTEGTTGVAFSKTFATKNVIVVTHHDGFKTPNFNEIDEDKRKEILDNEAQILTTTHAFAGVSRGVRMALGTYSTTEILAYAFRTFGQGTKVCAEIAMMAADAGLVPVDRDILCVAGTGRGADTVWIVKAANTNAFTDLKMRACLCKPLDFN